MAAAYTWLKIAANPMNILERMQKVIVAFFCAEQFLGTFCTTMKSVQILIETWSELGTFSSPFVTGGVVECRHAAEFFRPTGLFYVCKFWLVCDWNWSNKIGLKRA